jgi:hypothetical protein
MHFYPRHLYVNTHSCLLDSVLQPSFIIMSSIEEKMESLLLAMGTLRAFALSETTLTTEASESVAIEASETTAMKAMETVHTVVLEGFRDNGDYRGEFVDDDDFFNETFALDVVQVMIDVIQAGNDSSPPLFYSWAFGILLVLSHTLNSNEVQCKRVCLSLTKVLSHNDSSLTLFSYLVMCTWTRNMGAPFEGAMMTLLGIIAKLDVTPGTFYSDFCLAQDICIKPGVEFENEDSFPQVVNYILGRTIEHTYDEEAQKPVRVMLCHLVGEEAAKKIIDRSDDTAKDSFRAALEELQHPSSVSSTTEAMETVHATMLNGFEDDRDSSARFVSRDHFEQQVLSVKVLRTIIDVLRKPNDEYRYSHVFYFWAAGILLIIGRNRKFDLKLTKYNQAFFTIYGQPVAMIASNALLLFFTVAQCAWMSREIDDAVLSYFANQGPEDETTLNNLYPDFCLAEGNSCCIYRGVDFEDEDMFGRVVSFILCGIIEHMHDEDAQKSVFVMLRHFVGEEAAKKMAEYAEMRYCQDTKYAISA